MNFSARTGVGEDEEAVGLTANEPLSGITGNSGEGKGI